MKSILKLDGVFVVLCLAGFMLAVNLPVVADNAKPASSTAAAVFAGVFGDNMVVQRNRPIRVWGQAGPAAVLTLTFAGESHAVVADANGQWQTELPALAAGGPYNMVLSDAAGAVEEISDVLVGDVWLCSGQSNMAFKAGEVNQSGVQWPGTSAGIRLKTISRDSHVLPQSNHAESQPWRVADAASVHDFSAVCFLLAHELQKLHDIPFGLIDASWGGSGIKPWISARGLRTLGTLDQPLDWLQLYSEDKSKALQEFGVAWENWWTQLEPGAGQPWKEPATVTSGWQPAPAVMQDWKQFGDPGLVDHNGMVWYRKSFELSEAQAQQDAVLTLGGIDEVDYLWVNGHFIDSQFGWGTPRTYTVPQKLLQPGENTITLNILSTWASGGMLGPNDAVGLRLPDDGTISLADGWLYRKIPAGYGLPLRTPWESIGGLSGLFNAMIAPLQGLQLTGAIWYQGETDTGDTAPYEALLNALAADWRERFGSSLPFLIVQLPAFGEYTGGPVESGWAAIRDAQRRSAAAHPDTGLVVTTDTGDRTDLHPPDKRVIGRRAAAVASVLAYGGQGLADGLSPASVFVEGDAVVVDFDPAVDKLFVAGAKSPIAFELCDAGGDCVYADTRFEGNRVWLSSDTLENPERVRYCWADAPVCNLYGRSGLPVNTFEVVIDPQ